MPSGIRSYTAVFPYEPIMELIVHMVYLLPPLVECFVQIEEHIAV